MLTASSVPLMWNAESAEPQLPRWLLMGPCNSNWLGCNDCNSPGWQRHWRVIFLNMQYSLEGPLCIEFKYVSSKQTPTSWCAFGRSNTSLSGSKYLWFHCMKMFCVCLRWLDSGWGHLLLHFLQTSPASAVLLWLCILWCDGTLQAWQWLLRCANIINIYYLELFLEWPLTIPLDFERGGTNSLERISSLLVVTFAPRDMSDVLLAHGMGMWRLSPSLCRLAEWHCPFVHGLSKCPFPWKINLNFCHTLWHVQLWLLISPLLPSSEDKIYSMQDRCPYSLHSTVHI